MEKKKDAEVVFGDDILKIAFNFASWSPSLARAASDELRRPRFYDSLIHLNVHQQEEEKKRQKTEIAR